MVQRKIRKCNYCGWVWATKGKPKVCPRCHNPYYLKPKYKKKKRNTLY